MTEPGSAATPVEKSCPRTAPIKGDMGCADSNSQAADGCLTPTSGPTCEPTRRFGVRAIGTTWPRSNPHG